MQSEFSQSVCDTVVAFEIDDALRGPSVATPNARQFPDATGPTSPCGIECRMLLKSGESHQHTMPAEQYCARAEVGTNEDAAWVVGILLANAVVDGTVVLGSADRPAADAGTAMPAWSPPAP